MRQVAAGGVAASAPAGRHEEAEGRRRTAVAAVQVLAGMVQVERQRTQAEVRRRARQQQEQVKGVARWQGGRWQDCIISPAV